MMRARFQGDIGGSAAREFTRLGQRLGLGVRPAADSGHAGADDHRAGATVAHDQGADGRVGRGAPGVFPRQPQRRRHEAAIETLCSAWLRLGVTSVASLSLLRSFPAHPAHRGNPGLAEIAIDRGEAHRRRHRATSAPPSRPLARRHRSRPASAGARSRLPPGRCARGRDWLGTAISTERKLCAVERHFSSGLLRRGRN